MKRLLIALLLSSFFVTSAHAVFEFKSKLCATGTNCTDEDYNAISTWENAMDGAGATDLSDSSMKCGSWDAQVGSDIADATSVTWDSGSSTGTLYHMTNRTDGTDYYLEVLTGSLADNDTVTDTTNTFDVNGTPDSCQLTAEIYDDDGEITESATFDFAGFTTNSTNYLKLTAPFGERHNGTDNSRATIYGTGGSSYDDYIGLNSYAVVEWLILRLFSGSYSAGVKHSTGTIVRNCFFNGGVGIRAQATPTYSYNNTLRYTTCGSGRGAIYSEGGTNYIYNNTIINTSQCTKMNYSSVPFIFKNNICTATVDNYEDGINSLSENNICGSSDDCHGGQTFSTGTQTSATANKLIDSGATFITDGVIADAVVRDTTDGINTYIISVDSETQLTLNDDIFTGSENYSVYKNFVRTLVFRDSANDDFRLNSEDEGAIDKGLDLSSTLTIDIDANERPQLTAYDIGASEYAEVINFESKICATGTNCTDEDFNAISTWENVMDDDGAIDITLSSVRCGDWDGQSGSNISSNTAVTWDSGESTGQLVYMTNRTGSTEYYLEITSGRLQDDDVITDATNSFVINGNPSACRISAGLYDDDGDINDAVTIDGFTTDSDHFISVSPATGEEHQGTKTTGAGIYYSIPDYGAIISVQDHNVHIHNLRIYASACSGQWGRSLIGFGNYASSYAYNNLLYATASCNISRSGNSLGAVLFDTRYSTAIAYNNFIFDLTDTNGANAKATSFSWGSIFANNTVTNTDTGIAGTNSTTNVLINNLSCENTSSDYLNVTTSSASTTNNLSCDATAPAYGTYYINKSISFEDASNGNLSLTSGDTDAIDFGSDLSSYFEEDIFHTSRPQGSAWDIGAYEYAGAVNYGGLLYIKGSYFKGMKTQ